MSLEPFKPSNFYGMLIVIDRSISDCLRKKKYSTIPFIKISSLAESLSTLLAELHKFKKGLII